MEGTAKRAINNSATIDGLKDIRLDSSIGQAKLNIEDRVRRNLLPWNGQFSPQLIDVLLGAYAKSDSVVVDPFVGSGTVLVECARAGLQALGSDINPAAYHMAKVYEFANLDPTVRAHRLASVDELIASYCPQAHSLFGKEQGGLTESQVKNQLVCLVNTASNEQIRTLLEALVVLLDFHKPSLNAKRVCETWSQLRQIVLNLPYSKRLIQAINEDARSLPISDNSVDLVITSPPYINVHNYHEKFRASSESLGWNVLYAARSEIGSNRKHRGNRFLTVTQYCLDITDVLFELARICCPGAKIVLIVGRESNVRKTPFYNGAIVARLVDQCTPLDVEFRQERVFKNKYGLDIFEDILHCHAPAQYDKHLTDPRTIASQVLESAAEYTVDESLEGLKDALRCVWTVKKSPLYKQLRNR